MDTNITDIRKLFGGGSFLKYHDLAGGPYVTVITSAKVVEFEGKWGADIRIECELEPNPDDPTTPTQVSCTKRLARQIAQAIGEADYSKWPGKSIEFFATEVNAFGKIHEVVGARRVGSNG